MPSKKAIPCSHWDEQRIKTDNFYRFQYLSEFGGFGQEDIDAIHAAAPVVAPLVPAIVDAVYVKLFSFDTTKVSLNFEYHHVHLLIVSLCSCNVTVDSRENCQQIWKTWIWKMIKSSSAKISWESKFDSVFLIANRKLKYR